MSALTDAQSVRNAKYDALQTFITTPDSFNSTSLQDQIDDNSDAILSLALLGMG